MNKHPPMNIEQGSAVTEALLNSGKFIPNICKTKKQKKHHDSAIGYLLTYHIKMLNYHYDF